MMQTVISITGITCDACLKLIKRRVGSIAGVADVSVEKSGTTTIFADRTIRPEEIHLSLQGTPYTISPSL